MSSSRTLSRKFRTFFTCIKPRFDPSIILLYIAVSVEQYCDITRLNALPENEGILEGSSAALYRQKSREYIPTTLALSAARFSVTTLQRLPGGLAELEALAEQLPPEDRAPDPMPSSPP